MPSFPRRRSRRSDPVALPVIALVTLIVSNCAIDRPYARDNPFDADAEVVITILGPDSIHASNERITVAVASDAPLPPEPLGITWESSNSALLLSLGGGAYRTGSLPPQYQSVQILAYFGERVVSKTVHVGRRP